MMYNLNAILDKFIIIPLQPNFKYNMLGFLKNIYLT